MIYRIHRKILLARAAGLVRKSARLLEEARGFSQEADRFMEVGEPDEDGVHHPDFDMVYHYLDIHSDLVRKSRVINLKASRMLGRL